MTPVNDPPIAVGDSETVDEGDTLSIEASALLANDTDEENDTLRITAVGDAVNGRVLLDGATIIYEHDDSETTAGRFSYTLSDGTDTDTATVKISVTPSDGGGIGVWVILLITVVAVAIASGGGVVVLRNRNRT